MLRDLHSINDQCVVGKGIYCLYSSRFLDALSIQKKKVVIHVKALGLFFE